MLCIDSECIFHILYVLFYNLVIHYSSILVNLDLAEIGVSRQPWLNMWVDKPANCA